MLTQLFLAARAEGIAPFPYVRFLIRLGLEDAAARLNTVDPQLAVTIQDSSSPAAAMPTLTIKPLRTAEGSEESPREET